MDISQISSAKNLLQEKCAKAHFPSPVYDTIPIGLYFASTVSCQYGVATCKPMPTKVDAEKQAAYNLLQKLQDKNQFGDLLNISSPIDKPVKDLIDWKKRCLDLQVDNERLIKKNNDLVLDLKSIKDVLSFYENSFEFYSSFASKVNNALHELDQSKIGLLGSGNKKGDGPLYLDIFYGFHCLGQDLIGLLGSGNSKGDGPAKNKVNKLVAQEKKIAKDVRQVKQILKSDKRTVERKPKNVDGLTRNQRRRLRKKNQNVQSSIRTKNGKLELINDAVMTTREGIKMPMSGDPKAQSMARSIACPGIGSEVPRVQTGFDTESIATANTYQFGDVNWDITADSSVKTPKSVGAIVIPKSVSLFVVKRIPQCNMIMHLPNTAAATFQYRFNFFQSDGTTVTTIQLVNQENNILSPVFATSELAYSPHGKKLYAGSIGSFPSAGFFWLDAGGDLVVAGSGTDLQVVNVGCGRYFNEKFTPDILGGQATIAGGIYTITMPVLESGYYCVRIVAPLGLTTTATITFRHDGATFSHRAFPYYENHDTSILATRVVGTSLLLTNRAPILSKGGKAYMVQTNGDPTQLFEDPVGKITSVSNVVTKGFEHGVYGYMKPQDLSSFDYTEYAKVQSAGIARCGYPLDDDGPYLAFVVHLPQKEERDGQWMLSTDINFKTLDQFFDKRISDVSRDQCANGCMLIANMPQFYENDSHFADIIDNIRKVAGKVLGGVIKYGPAFMPLLA